MSPKSKRTATTNPTKKSPQTTSEPENRSCIYSMAKYAFAEQKEATSESTESGPQVKELLDLYGLLEVREPEVRKIPLSQRSEKTVTAPKITTRRQVRKMSDVSTKLKAIVAENKEKDMSQSYASLGEDYDEIPRGGEVTSEDEDGG